MLDGSTCLQRSDTRGEKREASVACSWIAARSLSPLTWLAGIAASLVSLSAFAATSTPGYPEPVVQWVVQKGESCAIISKSVYGSPQHVALLLRYNSIDCSSRELPEGATLVLPASVTSVPDARVKSMSPAVQARPSGGGWSAVQSGAPLYKGHNVNTLETGRADIEFVDRTRIFLAENTLVVVYGTAARTNVRKNVRPTVDLEQGEVRAGLAALRGDSARVGVAGGGDVQATSRDTVVQRKGDRTTVAVFDGSAAVRNGGKKVDVPTNHGTRFVGTQPPVAPRPLPPAPQWEPGGFPAIVMASPQDGATLTAGWQAVEKAKAYRFEIARDEAFGDLLARQEIPANVRSFRAEKIPVGTYYVSVRAIDTEEYLGIASVKRSVRVITPEVRQGHGALRDGGLEVTPYTVLSLGGESSSMRIAFDQGEPMPIPSAIDFGKVHPTSLRLIAAGGAELEIPVVYRTIQAAVAGSVDRTTGRVQLRATLSGTEGIDLAGAVKPAWRVHLPEGAQRAVASIQPDGSIGGLVTAPSGIDSVVAELVDGSGGVLGRSELRAPPPPPAPSARPLPAPQIGVIAPPVPISAFTDVVLYSPSTPNAFAISSSMDRQHGETAAQGTARASGGLGRFGIDASLSTASTADGRVGDESAWLGARVRTWRSGMAAFEHGFALRVGLPASFSAPGSRIEPSSSIGGVAGSFSWVANAGARVRLSDSELRAPSPTAQGFLLAGGTWAVHPLARLYAMIDAHVLPAEGSPLRARGGASLGLEAGRMVFGSFALRASPFDDVGAPVTLHVALGIRDR